MLNKDPWALNSGVPFLPLVKGSPRVTLTVLAYFYFLPTRNKTKSPLPLQASPTAHLSHRKPPSHPPPIAHLSHHAHLSIAHLPHDMCAHVNACTHTLFFPCLPLVSLTVKKRVGLMVFTLSTRLSRTVIWHHTIMLLGLPPSASPITFLLLTPEDLLRLSLP